MLDLIWILLFFFLMISTLRRDTEEKVNVDTVPYLGNGDSRNNGRPTATLHVRATGEMVLEGRNVDDGELQSAIEALPGGADTALIIEIDRDARVEDLLTAEDAGRAAGLECYVRRQVDRGS